MMDGESKDSTKNEEEQRREPSLAVQAAVPAIVSQINAEIAIRDRLADTVQARLDWALALKASLQGGKRTFYVTVSCLL